MDVGKSFRYFHKRDLFFYGIFIGILIWGGWTTQKWQQPGNFLCIYRYNTLELKVSLSEDRVLHYADKVIAIEGGEVRILQSSCPHQLCVRQRAISRVGECNLCAPMGILLKIEGQKTGKNIDALSR